MEEINQKESTPEKDKGSKKEILEAKVEESVKSKPQKPPKPEDKPFKEFINEELIPTLKKELNSKAVVITELIFKEQERPVVGGKCHCLYLNIDNGRRVWLCFNDEKISSIKSIILSERGSNPSLIESFLIDEKKTTLSLLVSRLLQRLNGQKWLLPN